MRFYPMSGSESDRERLSAEYKAGRRIGKISLGETWFFFRSAYRIYYIPYTDIRRYFRRVLLVPARMCCGKGELEVEYFVICGEDGELAQIQLPGSRAGKALMEDMAKRAPDAAVGMPPQSQEG